MAGWSMTNGLGNSWSTYLGHLGEDYAKTGGGSLGQPVYAAAAGEVITVLQNCGNYVDVVIIKHQVDGISEPIYSFYGHIEANGYVQVGDQVSRRQQVGVLGNPVTFSPHLHFEIKNHTALVNPPFSSCSNTSKGIYISAGYSGKRNDYSGGDYYDPSNDGVTGNRYYHPTRFIQNRLP
jgi:murein DD-endopeptidase MepM/ murein hydrolase activator NlpD